MTATSEYTVPEVIDRIGLGTFQYRMMLVTGVLWMGDALEIMMLSLIGQNLKCEWGVSDIQEASLTTLVFAGENTIKQLVIPRKPVLVLDVNLWSRTETLYCMALISEMGIGSPLFGILGDKFGRKTSCVIGSFFLAFYGFMSAAAPNFKTLATLRFFVGCYMGSVPQVGFT